MRGLSEVSGAYWVKDYLETIFEALFYGCNVRGGAIEIKLGGIQK